MDILVNLYKDDKISFYIGKKYNYSSEKDYKLITGDIICFDNVKVGTLEGYLIDNDSSFYDVCSDISDDMKLIADVVCDKDGSVKNIYCSTSSSFDSCIFILTNISIDTKYRNLGIGSQILKSLFEVTSLHFNTNTILLFADAYDYVADEEIHKLNTDRLVRLCERCGFKNINKNVMFYKYENVV